MRAGQTRSRTQSASVAETAGSATVNVIMVVDPCELDYGELVAAGDASGLRFTFLSSGEQALRWPADARIVAWMIALQLPDMTGLELQQRLRPRLGRTPVIMVDGRYDAGREVSVLAVGHPYYACKPLDGSWVDKLR